MGSVISYDDVCDECGWDGRIRITDTNNGEVWVSCTRCGYEFEWRAKIDRGHLRATGEEHYLVTRAGHRVYYPVRKPGHGVFLIAYRSGSSTFGGLRTPLSKRVIGQFVARLCRDDVDLSRSYLACWEPETQRHRNVFGEWFDQFEGLHGADDRRTGQTAAMRPETWQERTGSSGEDGWDLAPTAMTNGLDVDRPLDW